MQPYRYGCAASTCANPPLHGHVDIKLRGNLARQLVRVCTLVCSLCNLRQTDSAVTIAAAGYHRQQHLTVAYTTVDLYELRRLQLQEKGKKKKTRAMAYLPICVLSSSVRTSPAGRIKCLRLRLTFRSCPTCGFSWDKRTCCPSTES